MARRISEDHAPASMRTIAVLSLLLTFTVGILTGMVTDQYFRLRPMRDVLRRPSRAVTPFRARSRDPRQWMEDSARMAEWEHGAAQRTEWLPREIARQQVMMHCAVRFEFRDTLSRHMQLMNAR